MKLQPVAASLEDQLKAQLRDLQLQLDSENAKTAAYEQQERGFTEAAEFTVKAAKEMVESAQDKLDSKTKLIPKYTANELQARLNYDRQKSLFEAGAKPEKEVEKLKKEWDGAQAELQSIHEDVQSLVKELAAKESELEEKRLLAQTKIDYAVALKQGAKSSAAKIQKEKRDIELKLEELKFGLTIYAPRDGTIFRMPVYEQGQTVKEGDPILTIVPESTQNAVELWVPGNDMPLVQVGQEARLQFEGWPAVQFPGWPSVAVGTFSGMVTNVDATDNGKGQFRVLILPNENRQYPMAIRSISQTRRARQRMGHAPSSLVGIRNLAATQRISGHHFRRGARKSHPASHPKSPSNWGLVAAAYVQCAGRLQIRQYHFLAETICQLHREDFSPSRKIAEPEANIGLVSFQQRTGRESWQRRDLRRHRARLSSE